MPTPRQTTAAIVQAVAASPAVSGWTVIQAQQDAVRVAEPYITVQPVTDEVAYGWPHEDVTDDGDDVVSIVRQARYWLTAYGADGVGALAALGGLLLTTRTPLALALQAAGVTPQRTIGPRNLTAPYRSGMEPRAQLEVIVQYVLSTTDTDAVDVADRIVVGLTGEPDGPTFTPAFEVP
jgi:hypothetical protein